MRTFFTTLLWLLHDRYCKDDKAPYNNDRNVGPGCSVWFAGEFFDNVIVHRRGATSLSWPKPKFRIDAAKHGKAFNIKDGSYRVKELDLNSGEGLPKRPGVAF